MPLPTPDSYQLNRITASGNPGVIVLSSTYRLLYISQRATILAGSLDSAFLRQPCLTTLPDCLMNITHEARALRTSAATKDSPPLYRVNRIIGAGLNAVHIQVFLMPGSHPEDERIVLLLSRPPGPSSLPTEQHANIPLSSSRP